MSLKEYHRKRDFKKTAEPYGSEAQAKGKKFLYVIQKHAASHLHYDFRLELDGVLKSWAVPKGPSLDPKVKHLAMHVEDHPIGYANFEGIIPKGEYGGGTVMIWDFGRWEPVDENVRQAYHKGNLTFNLYGKKLQGRWKLIKLKKSPNEKGKEAWLLFKISDEYSKSEERFDIKKNEPYSALTDRSMKQIAEEKERTWTRKEGEVKDPKTNKKKSVRINLSKISGAKKTAMPDFIHPELATLVVEPPKGDKWLHEIKWDGYRLHARIYEKEISLLTRRGNNWTSKFPAIVQALRSLRLKNIILDGEVIALDKNKKTNFQILQNSMEDTNVQNEIIYYVFDILYYDGYSLVDVPLEKRKEILKKIIMNTSTEEIKYNDHIVGNGDQVYKNACDLRLEGIVSKRANSRYTPKRTKEWLKVKCTHRQEFVIGGYTDPKSSRQYFGALLIGYFDENKDFIYCGKVGTGFTQKSLKEVASIVKKYQQIACPFTHFPERVTKDIHWVKPKLVAEIEFLEMTDDGVLRHPSFKGLREDKKAQDVTLEQPKDIEEVKMQTKTKTSAQKKPQSNKYHFTNLSRVLYPEQGFTKQDLADYYESVADWILPYIKNRPLTLVRCPTGNHKNCFYQKHMNENVPTAIKSVPVMEHGKPEPYIYINNLAGLMALVQMGVLEIHPWGSHIKDVEKPDTIIFDLDPAPDVDWLEVIDCAKRLKEFLDYLKLKSFVKTTGGKGLHIVIPIKPTLDWEEVRNITKRIADLMVETDPTKYVATMSKAKRTGKIFIDYVRNTRGATAVAPYSTRARSHAPIAVPLAWEELTGKIKPNSFTIENINQRLKHLKDDPWKDFCKTKQTITVRIKKLLGL